jgi:hypothetical protein
MDEGNHLLLSSGGSASGGGGEKNQVHGTHHHRFIQFTVSSEETVNSLSLHHQSHKKAAGFPLK